MKCESNKIGQWLDENYAVAGGQKKSDYECGVYVGALEVLKCAGFNIDAVPCGKQMIHIVNPPEKIELIPSNQMEMPL